MNKEMSNQTEKKQWTLYGVIKRYFTEPFKDYDGNWKGIVYYEEIRMRKECIKFWVIMIVIITSVVLFNVL
tara:strand:+ start:66 stop:278 length:213 start_codon:yes stop_codon:yes gene_type:complete